MTKACNFLCNLEDILWPRDRPFIRTGLLLHASQMVLHASQMASTWRRLGRTVGQVAQSIATGVTSHIVPEAAARCVCSQHPVLNAQTRTQLQQARLAIPPAGQPACLCIILLLPQTGLHSHSVHGVFRQGAYRRHTWQCKQTLRVCLFSPPNCTTVAVVYDSTTPQQTHGASTRWVQRSQREQRLKGCHPHHSKPRKALQQGHGLRF